MEFNLLSNLSNGADVSLARAFLKDVETMVRTLVAGIVAPSPKPRSVKPSAAKRIARKPSGDRK
jgi:hypothetical protein